MPSKLELLIGQKIEDIKSELSTVFPIENPRDAELEGRMTVFTLIVFNDYSLRIYNKHEFICRSNRILSDILGDTVESIVESKKEIRIAFSMGDIIRIDLSDDAYNDPEAIALYGPDNLCIVWN